MSTTAKVQNRSISWNRVLSASEIAALADPNKTMLSDLILPQSDNLTQSTSMNERCQAKEDRA